MSNNTQATFEAQFMKKLSNTEAELKKGVTYKKSMYNRSLRIPLIRSCNIYFYLDHSKYFTADLRVFGEYFYPASYLLPRIGFIVDAVIDIFRLSNVSVKLGEFKRNVLSN